MLPLADDEGAILTKKRLKFKLQSF